MWIINMANDINMCACVTYNAAHKYIVGMHFNVFDVYPTTIYTSDNI